VRSARAMRASTRVRLAVRARVFSNIARASAWAPGADAKGRLPLAVYSSPSQ
jgi:hypothetical protein